MIWNESGVNMRRFGEIFRVEKGVCVSVCWGLYNPIYCRVSQKQ